MLKLEPFYIVGKNVQAIMKNSMSIPKKKKWNYYVIKQFYFGV